jgi:hypothetical protein
MPKCLNSAPGGDLVERRAGLPQGSPLSSVLSNLFLDYFDADFDVRWGRPALKMQGCSEPTPAKLRQFIFFPSFLSCCAHVLRANDLQSGHSDREIA